MPAPVINFVPNGPGWPRGQSGPMNGMGDMLQMQHLQTPDPSGSYPGAYFNPGQMSPEYGAPLDLSTAYGMSGMGAYGAPWLGAIAPPPAPPPSPFASTGAKVALVLGIGAALWWWFGGGQRSYSNRRSLRNTKRKMRERWGSK